jgi:hypothetical protein
MELELVRYGDRVYRKFTLTTEMLEEKRKFKKHMLALERQADRFFKFDECLDTKYPDEFCGKFIRESFSECNSERVNEYRKKKFCETAAQMGELCEKEGIYEKIFQVGTEKWLFMIDRCKGYWGSDGWGGREFFHENEWNPHLRALGLPELDPKQIENDGIIDPERIIGARILTKQKDGSDFPLIEYKYPEGYDWDEEYAFNMKRSRVCEKFNKYN